MKDYIAIATKYASDVISGEIPACWQIIRACHRHFDDLEKDWRYSFDEKKAVKACHFVEMQYHTKGKWAQQRKRLTLEPWQIFFICMTFGWVRTESGLRRFHSAFLLVPRKNGKSAMASAIGLYMLMADNEYGAEVYSGATTEKQAWEVFRPAKIMAQKNQEMREHFGLQINAQSITIMEEGARFEPLIGDPGDGSSPSCAIVDEVHEHRDSRLIDTMITGMGARDQGLMLYISTAGDNIEGPCYALQKEIENVLNGVQEDDGLFGMIYTIDSGDDWSELSTMIKANPNYGVSVGEEFLSQRLQDAKNNARKQSTFLTKHLNVWVGARDAYFNLDRWNNSGEAKLEDYKGRECIMAFDLASKVDLAALTLLFPNGDGTYATFSRYYVCEETAEAKESYLGWQRDGWLTVTDGQMIDFDFIEEDVVQLCKEFDVREVAYDPFQATMLVTRLMNAGVPVIELGATVKNLSEPMKMLDALIRSDRIKHDKNPITTWNLSNVVAKTDAKDNVFPRKNRPEDKIDGAVSLIMALNRAMIDVEQGIDFDNLLTVTF